MMLRKILLFFVILALTGGVPSYAEPVCAFKGHFDPLGKKIDLDVRFKDGSSLAASLVKTDDGHFRFEGKLDHLKTSIFDISSVLESSMEVLTDETTGGQYVRGNISSKYSLINYKPAREVSGYFEIKNGRLYLKSLAWAGISCEGYIGIFPPHEVDLNIALYDVSAVDIPSLSGCRPEDTQIDGIVSGQIALSGFADRPMIRGKLRAADGTIESLEYARLDLDFEGVYPVVHIADSLITDRDGLSFNLEGNFDLNNQCDILGGLTALKMSPVIDETSVRRDWTIKRRQDTKDSATEFKYRLQKPVDDSSASKSETDMLSIGHSIKF